MTQTSPHQRIRRVLSIDGGGIRGIIPALVIAHLEKKTAKPASQLFDLIVGTSTGGMLALGLALQTEDGEPRFQAKQMVKLYGVHGGEIFEQSLWRKLRSVISSVPKLRPVRRRLRSSVLFSTVSSSVQWLQHLVASCFT